MKIKVQIFTLVFATILMVCAVNNAIAQVSKVATNSADFLNIGVGARANGMGTATTGDVSDASALYWNPAGIASMTEKEVLIDYANWFVDTDHMFLGIVVPLKTGVAGIQINSLNMGTMEEVIDMERTGRDFGAYSLSVGGTYAAYVFDKLQVGGTAKYIMEKIDYSTSSTVGFDVGTLYESPFWGIRLGVSITNFGGKAQITGDNSISKTDLDQQYDDDYEPDVNLKTDSFNLPLKLRVGLAWDAIDKENVRTTLTVDGESPSSNLQNVSIGIETALLNETLFLRGGLPYLGKEDRIEKFNAGLGFNYELSDRITLDIGYTYQSNEYLGDVSRMSLGIKF